MSTLKSDALVKNPYVYELPGVTPEGIATCARLLQENQEHHHVFINSEHGFHNHTTHHLLAALGLGAPSQTLERIYKEQKERQESARSPHNEKDFDPKRCLGDDNYYSDYVEFFKKELENEKYQGKIDEFIEDYLFNKDYFVLVFSGAYHAFIHLGYALEFQLKTMAVEGLAMAAIDRVGVQSVLENLPDNQSKDGDKTALDLIQLVVEDHRFDQMVFYNDEGVKVIKFLERGGGPLIAEYAQMWKCDTVDLRRAGILVSTAAIRSKKALRLDFFLMHATTSSLFVDILVNSFKSRKNQLKFLRAKFAIDLLYYVAYGRPKLNLQYLINEYQPSEEHSYVSAQNPWLPLVDKCLTHPDEHIPKTIRALIYAEKFDNTKEKNKLPYLKIAQMVMDALFPSDKKDWVHEGVGWDEYWKTVEDL